VVHHNPALQHRTKCERATEQGSWAHNTAERTHKSPQRMRSTVIRLSALVGLPGSGKKGCVKMCRSSPSCSTTVGRSKRGGSGDLYVRQGRDVSSCCGTAACSARGGAADRPARDADHPARTAQGSKRHCRGLRTATSARLCQCWLLRGPADACTCRRGGTAVGGVQRSSPSSAGLPGQQLAARWLAACCCP